MSCNNPHTINWFEVPAVDIERARQFYAAVFKMDLTINEFGQDKMVVFPANGENVVHGALVQGEGYVPSMNGALVFFNGGNDLRDPLSRVEDAGGKILREKMAIGEHGFIAVVKDTEGNKIAMHSMN